MIKKHIDNISIRKTFKEHEKSYFLPPSILTHLPWVEFDDESQSVLLQDRSVGAVFELSLVSSEAKPDTYLEQLRDGLQGIFQDTFPQYRDEESPWILQFYVQDEMSMAYLGSVKIESKLSLT